MIVIIKIWNLWVLVYLMWELRLLFFVKSIKNFPTIQIWFNKIVLIMHFWSLSDLALIGRWTVVSALLRLPRVLRITRVGLPVIYKNNYHLFFYYHYQTLHDLWINCELKILYKWKIVAINGFVLLGINNNEKIPLLKESCKKLL